VNFLVDANVLSEPTKPQPARNVVKWLRDNEAELVLSPIVLGELESGILALPTGRRRRELLNWLTVGPKTLNVLVFDSITASVWARLVADLKRKGRAMSIKDSLIAATALQHGLLLATRNTADYRFSGIKLTNPFNT
jgi:predicted nucleic acid-binding protein